MNFDEYSPLAFRTAKILTPEMNRYHAIMGVVTELGEIVDAFKKHHIYGKSLDMVNLAEEIGDAYWYVNLYECTEQAVLDGGFMDDAPKLVGLHTLDLTLNLLGVAGYMVQTLDTPEEMRQCMSVVKAGLGYLCRSLDIDVASCLSKNINKLAARYGETYSDYSALNRDLAVERGILEA